MKIQLDLEAIQVVTKVVYNAAVKQGAAPEIAWKITHSTALRLGVSSDQAYALTRAARRAYDDPVAGRGNVAER